MEILPVSCFVLMLGLYSGSWRERFLWATVSWGVIVLFVTESLSLWHGLNVLGLAICWSLLLVIFLKIYLKSHASWPIFQIPRNVLAISSLAGGILLVTAFIAFKAAPNNWDSMTYHLARVGFWAQNKTIAMYPTNNLRQISYPPWPSYAMSQFYILSHGDAWVNYIQWFSSLGSMIGASLIASRLKADTLVQSLAAVLVATIPMGILQSTSTQSDYVTSFWLMCFVYFGLRTVQETKWPLTSACGAALGLAWLVKGTAYVYSLPFLIWFAIAGTKTQGRRFLPHLAAIVLIAALLNSTYYVRNFELSGKIIPPTESSNVVGQSLDGKVIISNLVLNLGLHAATVWDSSNRQVEKTIDQIHQWLGIEEGDSRVVMGGGVRFQLLDASFRFHEDYAGNLIHTLLILICVPLSLFLGLRKECHHYLWAVLGGVFLFVLTIKWSPYHSRYHLPLFVLFAPFLAIVLGRSGRSGIFIIAGLLTLAALPWVFGNKSRPLEGKINIVTMPRIEQYFVNNPGFVNYAYPLAIASQVNCKNIGIIDGGDTWEYPLMLLSHWQKYEGIRFEHVMVNNISSKLSYPQGPFEPCSIIQQGENNSDRIAWLGHTFKRVDQRGSIASYLRIQ